MNEDRQTIVPASEIIKTRFFAKVVKTPGCWLWSGAKLESGYGVFKGDGMRLAHRISWAMHNGAIPNGLFVLHKCDNPSCVNPDHLFMGTHTDNMQDMLKKGRKSLVRKTGEQNGNSILNAAQVVEIRKIAAAKTMPHRAIAAQYGVSIHLIRKVVYREVWKHIYT